MKIVIEMLTGRKFEAEIEPSIHVGDLKKVAFSHFNIPVENQRLVFNDVVMNDEETLAECGLVDGGRVILQVSLPPRRIDEPIDPNAHLNEPFWNCVGCEKEFDNVRVPHTLACGRNICDSCLSLLNYRAVDKRIVTCPTSSCNARTIIEDPTSSEVLPVNEFLASAVNSLKSTSPSDSVDTTLCAECGNEANKFCHQCNVNLCDGCFEEAHKLKIFSSHLTQVVELDSSVPPPKLPPMCPRHHIPMDLSCSSCGGVAVCHTCHKYDGSHAGSDHVVESVSTIADRLRNLIEEAMSLARNVDARSLNKSQWCARTFQMLVGEGNIEAPENAEPGSGISEAIKIVHAFFDQIRLSATAREVELISAIITEGNLRRAALHHRQAEALQVVSRTKTVLAIAERVLKEPDHILASFESSNVLEPLRAVQKEDVLHEDDPKILPNIRVILPETLVAQVESAGSVLTMEDDQQGGFLLDDCIDDLIRT